MPVYFNLIEKVFMKGLNLGPAPVADISGSFSFFAIDAAIRMNLFEILADNPSTINRLAELCGCNVRGFVTLLDLLETLGYVKEKNQIYSITRMTRKWLLDSSEINFKPGFEYYSPTITDLWPHLADSFKTGVPYIKFYEWMEEKPATAEVYQKYMMSLAKMVIPELINKIALTETKILDIGGSHGMYSIALCNKYPSIKITIIDSHYAMPLLEKNIKSAGLEHRISLVTGDFLTYHVHEKFDAVLLFNVFHEHKEEYNKRLSSQIAEILIPNGRLIVLESLKKKGISPMLDFVSRIYGLMFFHFLGGQNYTFTEIRNWLHNSGFRKTKTKSLYKSGFSLIHAYRE